MITVTSTTTWIRSTGIPKIVHVPSSAVGTPNPGLRPKKPRAVYWRKRDAPIAVMSGTSRGALPERTVRDAFEQDRDPIEVSIATVSRIASDATGLRSRNPLAS